MTDVGRVEPPAPPEPTLRVVRVVFDVRDDGKDDNTGITIELKSHDGRLLAKYYDIGREWLSSQWVVAQLEMFESITPTDVLGCSLRMRIEPHGGLGHDTFEYWWRLEYAWGDQRLRETSREADSMSERMLERTYYPNIQPG